MPPSPVLEKLTYRLTSRLVRRFNRKAANVGERQASPWLCGIRPDHRGRYQLAARFVPPGAAVLDLACGVGYGSYILATRSSCREIVSVDLGEEAIAYARRHYAHPKITFVHGDAFAVPLEPGRFDAVVSFETVEHVEEDRRLLARFHEALRPGGLLVLSTPNELRMPYSPEGYRHHRRHYRPEELKALLEETGFRIREVFSQSEQLSSATAPGWEGKFNLAVCTRA